MAVLAFLRTLICMGVAVLIWFAWILTFPPSGSLLSILVPVWLGGIGGGVVACIFSPRQGIVLAFTSGVVLAAIFLWFRHVVQDLPLGPNTMLTLWPLWLPAAFYVGAYGYLLVLARKS